VTEPCPESKKMMVSLLLQGPRDVNSKLPGDTLGRSFEICPPFGCAHMYPTSFVLNTRNVFEKSYVRGVASPAVSSLYQITHMN